jgi:hypothetical protein
MRYFSSNLWPALALLTLVVGWAWLGIYEEREFATHHLFLRHRPSSRFLFRAPVGESDRPVTDLEPGEQAEEKLYREFVESGNGSKRSLYLGF